MSSDLVAFVGVSDLSRAQAFYEGVLSLRLVHRDDFACVFDSNGTMLRVTAVPEVAPVPHTVLGWLVRDIKSTVEELDVQFHRYRGLDQDDDGIWTTPGGDRVAWFADPDGNTLSLTQHAE
ncbi:MAG TPA: VOC family protein [Pseudonocardiaceae bacterium]|jgi:catechol 2,3-dioxygenase-like lactoylglutathione lyase family enzyme|nr:VOC family protein [Pseudonocardiaceae bacterium]